MKDKLENLEYKEFHKLSSAENSTKIAQSRRPESWKVIHFKGYPRFKRRALKGGRNFASKLIGDKLSDVIFQRRSGRNFSPNRKITLDKLSALLIGASITSVRNGDFKYESFRAYPSAGARYPLEIYVLVMNSRDIKEGLYHYHVRTHSIEYLWPVGRGDIAKCFPSQTFIRKSSVILFISGVMNRTTVKYFNRGYRFALIESGHVAQNFSLIAASLKLKCCAVGGYDDQKLSDVLELSGDELALYCLAIN